MSDTGRRGAPSSRDYDDWKAALDAFDRLADVRATLCEPIDEAQLQRDVAEIRKAARGLDTSEAPAGARNARRRWIAWMLFGVIWIAMACMAAGSIGAIFSVLS
jgi:hypothetical protein